MKKHQVKGGNLEMMKAIIAIALLVIGLVAAFASAYPKETLAPARLSVTDAANVQVTLANEDEQLAVCRGYKGDMNKDGRVNNFDIRGFLRYMRNPNVAMLVYADMDSNNVFNKNDVRLFVDTLAGKEKLVCIN